MKLTPGLVWGEVKVKRVGKGDVGSSLCVAVCWGFTGAETTGSWTNMVSCLSWFV